jgi:putative MATE family efflux protein
VNLNLRSRYDRDILRLAVPAFGALVAQPLYVLTDTAIVGHLGTNELAGLALASAVLLTLSSVLIFLAYGTTGIVGRHLGAGDERGAAHHGVQAVWLALVVGVFFAAVFGLGAEQFIGLFKAEPAVAEAAKTYLSISAIGVPAVLAVMAGTGYLRGLQDTRTPLIVALGSALVNLVVELIFVYPLDLGVAGSAWSTVIAEYLAAAVYVRAILRHAARAGVGPRPDAQALRGSIRGGVHLFLRTLALRGAFLLSTVVAAGMGTVELAAHEIGFQIWSLLALSLDAVAIAGQALVARFLGAGDTRSARGASERMITLAVATGVIFGLLVLIIAKPVASVFSDDSVVTDLTAFVLIWVAVSQPIGGHVFAIDGILIGAGDLRYLGRAMWISTAVFAACCAAVIGLDLGIGWLWAGLFLFMVARSITLQVRFRSDLWQVTGT